MQGWGRQVDEGKQQPRGSWRKRKTELPGGPKAHSRGLWVPVRPEWLLGLAEPSTLGGRTNLRCGVPRARVGGGECPFLVEPLSCHSIFLHQGFGLKLNIQKIKIMASGPITSRQIDGETMETVTDLLMLLNCGVREGS